jgi:NAD(P)H-flavin reductase
MGRFDGSILQAFRGSQLLSSFSESTIEGPNRGSDGSLTPFEPLIERIHFSRQFIVSYNFVLIAVILSLATIYRWERSKAEQRRELAALSADYQIDASSPAQYANDRASSEGSSSDSSSTLTGTATPPDVKGKVDENQPLLLPQRRQIPRRMRLVRRLRAFLVYQPKPVPFFNKTLPDNQTTLAVLALYALNLFYCLYGIPRERGMLFVFSDRFGCVFMANLPLLYLIAAKNQPFKLLIGYSYESLNIFHRRLGELMCLLALLHGLGIMGVWYTLLWPVLHISLYHFLTERIILLGLGTLVSYEALYFASLGSFRQRWYELFLFSHILLQFAAAILLWFHHHMSRPYVGVAVSIWLVDRIVFRAIFKSTSLQATVAVLEDGETVLVSVNWAITSSCGRKALPKSTISGWNPTDHVFLTIPALSRSAVLQAHPFTIASSSPNLNEQNSHAWLSLLVRGQDGFSRQLLDYACEHDTAQVRLDGPYGTQRPLEDLQSSDIAIVIAGGSGIAVAFPLVWALLQPHGDSSDPEAAALQQLVRKRRRVCFLWVIHSRSHLSWVPEERLEELREWGLDVCITAPTAENGRPDMAGIMKDWIDGYGDGEERVSVVVSGPDGMNRAVRNTCSAFLRQGKDVQVTVEKFGW